MATPLDIWGKTITFSNCVVGKNLNLVQVRGYASLDALADISSADVFDQKLNEEGTQRPLTPSHVKEAYSYAITSIGAEPTFDPRAFTEVILNVRKQDAVKILVEGKEVVFSELAVDDGNSVIADVIVRLDALSYPAKDYEPEISRVDGNHRLSGVPIIDKRDMSLNYPFVSFALFVGLSQDQERKIFADINGNQKNMDTSHLRQIVLRQKGDRSLLDKQTRPQWFAKQLSAPGAVFDGLVHMGGSKKGIKKALGANPPLTFTGLVTMVSHTLKKLDEEVERAMPLATCQLAEAGDKRAFETVMQRATVIKTVLENYWLGVKATFPEAWNDIKKSEFVLFDSTGSVALSQLAGDVIDQQLLDSKVQLSDFILALGRIRDAGITLKKTDYPGAAGMAGTSVIYAHLVSSRSESATGFISVLGQILEPEKSLLDD